MYHIAIPTTNIERSRNFYEKLGFHVVDKWEKPDQNLVGLWMEGEDRFRIELILHPGNKTISFPKTIEVQHLGIKVKNLDKIIRELKKDNIAILIPPTKGITVKQLTFIKDPTGFSVELYEK